MEQEEIKNDSIKDEEKEVDLRELVAKLWNKRRLVIIWCVVGAVLGLIVGFSIPKEYSVEVKLAPELKDSKAASGGLSALASMAGLSTSATGLSDAVYPMLYPDVVSSIPFLTGLFDVPVTTEDGQTMTVQKYMTEYNRAPWWNAVFKAPGYLIGLFKSDEKVPADHKLNSFKLTTEESLLVEALANRVSANVDNKTMVVTIDVKMQDPVVAAILADTVVARLQEYITEYRTDKARKDLEYAEKLNLEAKANYYKVQQAYADYVDRNQSIAFRSAQTVRERLENETALAFNLYNQTAQQVQTAQAKVQETTPVCAVISPATVPISPSSPRKFLILFSFVFLAFVGSAIWILYVIPMRERLKAKRESSEQSGQTA